MAEGCNSGKQGLKSHSLLVIWVHMLENLIYELKKIYIKISGNRFCYRCSFKVRESCGQALEGIGCFLLTPSRDLVLENR